MNTSLRILILTAVPAALLLAADSLAAAEPQLNGRISGLELLPQSTFSGAVFLFEFRGTVDGVSRKGFGYAEVFHEDLPDPGATSAIVGGMGELYLGARRYVLLISGGTLIGLNEDVFGLDINLLICGLGRCVPHHFGGMLTHEVFPPVILGDLAPAPAE